MDREYIYGGVLTGYGSHLWAKSNKFLFGDYQYVSQIIYSSGQHSGPDHPTHNKLHLEFNPAPEYGTWKPGSKLYDYLNRPHAHPDAAPAPPPQPVESLDSDMSRSPSMTRGRSHTVPMVVDTPARSRSGTRGRKRQRSSSSSVRRRSRGRRGASSASRRARGRRNRTQTFIKSADGPFLPKAKKRFEKPTNASKRGVEYMYEASATVNDANAVYVGHGVPCNQVLRACMMALVRKMFQIAGKEVNNFNADIVRPSTTTNFQVITQFFKDMNAPGLTDSTYTHDFSAGKKTYYDMAEGICASWDTTFGTVDGLNIPQLVKMKLVQYDNVVTAVATEMAEVYLDDATFQLKFHSALKFQNVTQTSAGTGDTKLNTEATTANPLRGRKFTSTKWTNTLIPRVRSEGTTASWGQIYCDVNNGGYTATAANIAGGAPDAAFKKLPPPGSFQNVKSCSFTIQPGEIRGDALRFSARFRLQSLFVKLLKFITDRSTNRFLEFGKISVLGFEHELKQSASEANVAVDVQYNWKMSVTVSYKKHQAVEIITVAN